MSVFNSQGALHHLYWPAALNWNSMIWKWKGETSNLISTKIGSFSYWTNYALFSACKLITSLHPNAFRLYARRRERCKWIMHSTRMMMLLLLQLKDINFRCEYTMILRLSLWLPCNYFIEIIFASNHFGNQIQAMRTVLIIMHWRPWLAWLVSHR